MTQYKDLSKIASDLLDDDYTSKVFAKIKSNAGNVKLTTETTRADGGALSSKVSMKFSGPSGFNVDKLQLLENGGNKIETSLTGVAPGLKFNFKGNLDKDAGDLGVEYTKGKLALTGEMDVIKLTKMNASLLTSMGALNVGGKVGYSFSKSSLTSYDVGCSYASGPLFAAVMTDKKLSEANVNVHYKVNNDLKVATSSNHSASSPLGGFTVGASLATAAGTAKAKLNSDGLVNVCLNRELAKKVTATPSIQLTASNLSSLKWGVGFTIG